MRKCLLFLTLLWAGFGLVEEVTFAATPTLVWHEQQRTFDADVSGVDLNKLLQKISSQTGWQVYLEPGTTHSASAKFKDLSRTEALRFLLGDLNFEISPEKNSVLKLYVFRTGANKATKLIYSDKRAPLIIGKDKRILNHLIVSLKPDADEDINALAARLGGKVIGKLDGVDSYLVEFPDEAAATAARQQLSKLDDVASVDPNYSINRPTPNQVASVDGSAPSLPFSLKADASGGDGKQIIIGLVDTAVQQLNANMQAFLLPALSVAGDADPTDSPTHGTTMAESMLYGMNATANQGQSISIKILPVDIYGTGENTTTFNVANGVVQAVNNGANIVSLSLGSDSDSDLLHNLLQQVAEKNIPIFAAAGNQPVTTPTYPAAYPEVVAVTAAQDQKGTVASYANRGSFVDVILPGATIVSYGDQRYYVNGTSVSTALASGMLAGLATATKNSPSQALPAFRERTAFKIQP